MGGEAGSEQGVASRLDRPGYDLLPSELRIKAAELDAKYEREYAEDWYPRYYDREGNPITLGAWTYIYEHDFAYRVVEKTQVGNVEVSTVWLGLDHSFDRSIPLIFETMVFGGTNADMQERYATEQQAREGHARIVKMLEENDGAVIIPDE